MLGYSAQYQLPPQSFKLSSFSYFRQSIFSHSSTTYKASPSQQQGSTLELLPQDLTRFRTLQKANKELQAALKLSQKRGRQSDDED
jgi:hypothetical protein